MGYTGIFGGPGNGECAGGVDDADGAGLAGTADDPTGDGCARLVEATCAAGGAGFGSGAAGLASRCVAAGGDVRCTCGDGDGDGGGAVTGRGWLAGVFCAGAFSPRCSASGSNCLSRSR